MKLTFGGRLRLEREERGIALSEISHQTKIKLSLLEGLERDNLSYWPHGLFGRAYIRAYADAIHVDPNPVLREYLELHPDPPDEFASRDDASGISPLGPTGRIWRAVSSAIGVAPPPSRRERTSGVAVVVKGPDTAPAAGRPASDAPQVAAVARLSGALQQAECASDLLPILGDIAELLEASGVVLWSWDSNIEALQPWLSHGYAAEVVDHLPLVTPDEDNAIASAYRSMSPRFVDGGRGQTGAIVVPVIASNRCLGVLSLELCDGREQRPPVRDAASILAALMARFVDEVPLAAVVNG